MGLFGAKKPVNTNSQSDQDLSSEFILGTIEDAVIMVSRDNIMHIFNQAAAKITGWSVNEALGLDFRSVLTFTDVRGKPCEPDEDPIFAALRTNKTVRNNKLMLRTRSKRLVPISIIVSPVTDPVPSVVAVLRDITMEKAEEEKRSDFISTASHEMRTPIAAIEGYLALALNPKVTQIDARTREYLEKAHNATQHLGQLFQDLLTSSKADDGRLQSFPQVVELSEITQQIAEAGKFSAQKKGLQLRYLVSGSQAAGHHRPVHPLFYVHVDPNRLREVLQNLVDNAIKYTDEGSVTVSITGDNNVAQIQIQDTGQGIAEEDIPHLFQKFYRVDNTLTRAVGGTGLGLYIAKRILELYDGQIWVESQQGKGSTFFVSLPRLTSEQALDIQRREALTTSPLDVSIGRVA